MAPKKPNGIGAKFTVTKHFLCPATVVKYKRANDMHNEKLSELVAVERKSTKVNRRDHACVTFRHDDFLNQTLHCVKMCCAVCALPPSRQQRFAIEEGGEEAPDSGIRNQRARGERTSWTVGRSERGHTPRKR